MVPLFPSRTMQSRLDDSPASDSLCSLLPITRAALCVPLLAAYFRVPPVARSTSSRTESRSRKLRARNDRDYFITGRARFYGCVYCALARLTFENAKLYRHLKSASRKNEDERGCRRDRPGKKDLRGNKLFPAERKAPRDLPGSIRRLNISAAEHRRDVRRGTGFMKPSTRARCSLFTHYALRATLTLRGAAVKLHCRLFCRMKIMRIRLSIRSSWFQCVHADLFIDSSEKPLDNCGRNRVVREGFWESNIHNTRT